MRIRRNKSHAYVCADITHTYAQILRIRMRKNLHTYAQVLRIRMHRNLHTYAQKFPYVWKKICLCIRINFSVDAQKIATASKENRPLSFDRMLRQYSLTGLAARFAEQGRRKMQLFDNYPHPSPTIVIFTGKRAGRADGVWVSDEIGFSIDVDAIFHNLYNTRNIIYTHKSHVFLTTSGIIFVLGDLE